MTTYQPATPHSNSIVRPNCERCKTLTRLFGIEPAEPGFELLTFVCPACDHIEVRQGKIG